MSTEILYNQCADASGAGYLKLLNGVVYLQAA